MGIWRTSVESAGHAEHQKKFQPQARRFLVSLSSTIASARAATGDGRCNVERRTSNVEGMTKLEIQMLEPASSAVRV
jgi:hypothetical protein